ncbi:hypothetical protein [Sphingomonas sp.]|uniref:hypothetical protein n=1 Tax=Sphingomonas sp. TaxID=28214 RepID=UPI0035A8D7F6
MNDRKLEISAITALAVIAIATVAREKAEHQRIYHGHQTEASAVLGAISAMLFAGVEKCIELSNDDEEATNPK